VRRTSFLVEWLKILAKTALQFEIEPMDRDWQKLRKMASNEVETVIKELPKALRERVRELPLRLSISRMTDCRRMESKWTL
jgi:hypothetical protein